MENLGRWIMLFGAVLFIVGGVIWLAGRAGIQWGRLPGDFRFESGGLTCIFPLATSIILSVVLTLVLNLVIRLLNR